MHIVYQLEFDDGTKYIGQTKDLNNRLGQHRILWRSMFSLEISMVRVLELCGSASKALTVEASYIEHYGLENLRNKTLTNFDDELLVTLSEKLGKNEEPDSPLQLIHTADQFEDTEKMMKYLEKKTKQLENRYISLFQKHEAIKENMKYIDRIIDKAVSDVIW